MKESFLETKDDSYDVVGYFLQALDSLLIFTEPDSNTAAIDTIVLYESLSGDKMLTETQLKYIELEKKKEQYKLYLEELKAVIELLNSEMGTGGHFQDTAGTVYQVADHKGRFVHFDKFEVKRTRRDGERSGSLSLTAARDLGYEVK